MSFSNNMREAESRTLAGQKMKGIVVKTDEKEGIKANRIKIRSRELHKNIKDDDLPWFTPGTQHSSNSGGNNQGKHGPIPPVGTEIWFSFRDDSQYFGEYFGAPIHKKTAVNDFTKAEEKQSTAGKGGGAGGASGGSGSTSSASGSGGAGAGTEREDYAKDYPHVDGDVNPGGGLMARNHKTDTEEETHITGTSRQIDGKGNRQTIINGGYSNPNKDAKEKFPKGDSVHVHGDCVIYASGNVKIHAGGNAEVIAKGNVKVHAGGTAEVASAGVMKVTGSTVEVTAKTHLKLGGPRITSQVPIVISGGGQAVTPTAPTGPKKAEPRARPKIETKADDVNY